jgi:DNA polymerase-3 subunit alpha
MTAFLMANSDDLEKMGIAIAECRRLGITVLPPDINQSFTTFNNEDNGNKDRPANRFGLAPNKKVGIGAI